MEFPDVGNCCEVDVCQQLDFLPIKCAFCLKLFCQHHNLCDKHNCLKAPIIQKEETLLESVPPTKYPCSYSICKNSELTPVNCSFCQHLVCLKHRHQIDHDCIKYVPPMNRMAEAADKIQKLTEQLSSQPKVKKIRNEKLAAKIQLMKLKGKCVGEKQIASEERVFFSVSFPSSDECSAKENPIPVFVSRHWTVGRVVDAVADLAQVRNENNKSKSPLRLNLFGSADGKMFPFDESMKVLLDREEIYNGQTLILEYVEKEQKF